MHLFRIRKHPLNLAAAAFVMGCNGCPSDGDVVPDINTCASPSTLQLVCDRDAPRAGRYPAVDNLVQSLRDTVPNPGDGVGTNPDDSFLLGCSYGIAIDGEPVFFGTNGMATPSRARRITDVAGVASVSKNMTALTILDLFERGRLPGSPTTTTVGDLLPGAPDEIADLTVHQLLAHTSGLEGAVYTAGYGTDAALADDFPELDQPGLHPRAMWYGLKDTVVPDPTLVDEPNNDGHYSNAGYRILGAIIDAYTVGDLDGVGLLANGGADIPTLDRATLTSAMTGGYEFSVRARVASSDLDEPQRMLAACVDTDNREDWLGDDYAPNFRWVFAQGVPLNDPANTLPANNVPSGFAPGIDSEPNGRRGPSGGWMMPIGDLLRLAIGVSENLYQSPAVFQQMSTPIAISTGFQFGYGLMLLGTQTFSADPAATPYPVYGHGGNLSGDGYAAFWRVVDMGTSKLATVIMCSEDAGSNRLNATLGLIADQFYTDYLAPGAAANAIDYDLEVAGCEPTPQGAPVSPLVKLEGLYAPELSQIVRGYFLREGSVARAELALRRDIMALPDGAQLLRAYDAGDYATAAQMALDLIDRGLVDLEDWRLGLHRASATTTTTTPTGTTSTAPTAPTAPATTTATRR
ncbi:MAG TPA: serine hydrolase [Myxococcota bacterium]|nr:serine hydrolase [Myxococcota bacterium]